MTVAPESGTFLALVGHHKEPTMVHATYTPGIGTLYFCCQCRPPLLLIIIEVHAPEGPKEYIPKKQWPPENLWIKAFDTAFDRFIAGLDKMIMNIKVRQ